MRPVLKRYLSRSGGVLACVLLFGVASSFAQDLGEAARQERLRRQRQAHRAPRVYTEQDLARPQILDPEDRARFEAARKNSDAPGTLRATELPGSESRLPPVSLGDLARYYRLLRQQQENEQAEVAQEAPQSQRRPRTLAPRSVRPAPARAVRVERGDSLWKLAKEHLGRGSEWPQLARLNPEIIDPDLIHVGQWIRLPVERGTQEARLFQVHEGDTLWKLAKSEFGSGNAWRCIAQANPHLQDANLIYPNQILAIPRDCTETP